MKQTHAREGWTPRAVRLAVGLSLDPVVQLEFALDTVPELRRMGRHRRFISNLLSKVKTHSFG